MTTPSLQAPSGRAFERMIRAAYEGMPAPDNSRILQICDELAMHHRPPARPVHPRQRKTSELPWWLVGLLLAGAATAGWWAGSSLQDKAKPEPAILGDEETPIQKGVKAPVAEPDRDQEVKAQPEPPDGDAHLEKKRSPVIYQREAQ
ncbi:MAG: hypothetical protein V3R83_10760 [Gammaproteobacteria bacterium]